MIIMMIIDAKAGHSVVNDKLGNDTWFVDHVLIITESNRQKRIDHIRSLCKASGSDKLAIQNQLTQIHPRHGRFIDLFKLRHKIDAEIICMLLDHFIITPQDIKSFVCIPGLRTAVKSYLANLPTSEANLAFLNRCLDQKTSIGAFCWTPKTSLNWFGPTEMINLLRDTIIPFMEMEFQVAFEDFLDSAQSPDPLILSRHVPIAAINRNEQKASDQYFPNALFSVQMVSAIFFLCMNAYILSCLSKSTENNYDRFIP